MYRTEYPKPQFERNYWDNLNGEWSFCIDHGNSGEAKKYYEAETNENILQAFDKTIEVPFCVESRLSGIEYKDFMQAVWYRRTISIPEERLDGRTVLHIGACDYYTTVWVNGQKAGDHMGGYVSFSMDITKLVQPGDNTIVIRAQDDTRSAMIPSGKQCPDYYSHGCSYTRTTGIWQTVWLEYTPKRYVRDFRIFPDVDSQSVTIQLFLEGNARLTCSTSYEGKGMGFVILPAASGNITVNIPLKEAHLWEIGKGRLYDLTIEFGNDTVSSYFGLRKIEYKDKKFYLNGKSVFQRLVLDQGFYPDGIYTAPSDEELLADIKRSKAMGFNGARLHQKVFEERFLYHCDKEGYIVWGEYPNWGLNHTLKEAIYGILGEWLEELKRDMNHPSIVGWCPFNETWDEKGSRQYDEGLELVYQATKATDPTRPCIDTSGNFHVKDITDIYDVHDYNQDPVEFARIFAELKENGTFKDRYEPRQKYRSNKPFFVSEYGGIGWSTEENAWGYGNMPASHEDFIARLKGLTDVLLDNPNIFAYCYTQLTNVEQEQNGLYTYDRQPKFPPEEIYPILSREAAVEKE